MSFLYKVVISKFLTSMKPNKKFRHEIGVSKIRHAQKCPKMSPCSGLFSKQLLSLRPCLEDKIEPSKQLQVSGCCKEDAPLIINFKKHDSCSHTSMKQIGNYLSTSNSRHSSNRPNMNKQRNATLFFPCSLARVASFAIPSASPREEQSSNKPLRSMACFKHSSAMSNCNNVIQTKR